MKPNYIQIYPPEGMKFVECSFCDDGYIAADGGLMQCSRGDCVGGFRLVEKESDEEEQ